MRSASVSGAIKNPHPSTTGLDGAPQGFSEPDLSSDLKGARRSVATQERAENAGRRSGGSHDASELRIRKIGDGLIEVGMIEQVERLRAHLELRAFPVWYREGFHQR